MEQPASNLHRAHPQCFLKLCHQCLDILESVVNSAVHIHSVLCPQITQWYTGDNMKTTEDQLTVFSTVKNKGAKTPPTAASPSGDLVLCCCPWSYTDRDLGWWHCYHLN